MRGLAGLLALDALYVLVGLAVLAATAAPRRGPTGVALALVTGWAALGVAWSTGLVLGVPRPAVALAAAAGAVAVLVRARGRPAARAAGPAAEGRAGRLAAAAGALVLALALAAGAARIAFGTVDTEWDSWAFWEPKAIAIHHDGRADGVLSLPNPEYPPLAPVSDAALLDAAGGVDPSLLLLGRWVLLSAGLLAVGALLRTRVRAALVWPSLGMLAVAPAVVRYFDSVLADPPLAILLALAAVSGTLWVLERTPGAATLCALFLAAASLTKSEGLVFGLLLAACLAAAGGYRRRGLVAIAAAPVLAILPWKLWLAAEGAPLSSPLYDFGTLADPGYLLDRLDRLSYALGEMGAIVFSWHWLLVAPLALVAGILAASRRPALAAVALGWPLAAAAVLATIYWISPAPVEWYVATSASRVLLSVLVVSGAVLPLSLAELVPQRRDGGDGARGLASTASTRPAATSSTAAQAPLEASTSRV